MSPIRTPNRLMVSLLLALQFLLTLPAFALTLTLPELTTAPTMDGNGDDWTSLDAVSVPMHKSKPDSIVGVNQIEFRGGTWQDRIYLYIEWDDPTHDTLHKPWVWDSSRSKYVKGNAREDRFVVQFAMAGDFTTDWLSGQEFEADTWHWKSSRSNPVGLAHDKSIKISRHKMLRAYKLNLPDGNAVYIERPSDAGDKLYNTQRFQKFVEQTMPKYVIKKKPLGSVADVSAIGVWSEGQWHLEISRLLNTGHEDYVGLPTAAGEIQVGFAVFDGSENDDHAISNTLTFQFSQQSNEGS